MLYVSLKLIKRRVKLIYTYVQLKIVCKFKIISLQLFLKSIIVVLFPNVLR